MKAWRKEAEKINARRKAGSKEPRARAQMQAKKLMPTIKGCGSNLLWYIMATNGYISDGMDTAIKATSAAQDRLFVKEQAERIAQTQTTGPDGAVKKFLKWLGNKVT